MTDLDDADLRALIDGSFADGPAQRPLTHTLEAGRHAVRRRRAAAMVGSGLAVTLALGGIAVLLDSRTETGGVAPVDTPNQRVVSADGARYPVVESAEAGGLDELVLRAEARSVVGPPGLEVLEQADDPFGPTEGWSVALLLRWDGRTWAYLHVADADGRGGMTTGAVPAPDDFRAWVAERVRETLAEVRRDPMATLGGDDLVSLDPDRGVVPRDGTVEVLEVVDDPWASDTADIRTAAVAFVHDGRERWTILTAERRGGHWGGMTQAVFADRTRWATFADYVAARAPQTPTVRGRS